jgi:hypothetical protein
MIFLFSNPFWEGHLRGAAMIDVIKLKLKLIHKGRWKIVAIDLPSMGEWQFIQPVLIRYLMNWNNIIILIHHTDDTKKFLHREYPWIYSQVINVYDSLIRSVVWPEIDMFITTEQYNHGLDGVYSVCMFHGQAGKGMTFSPEIVATFDAFFLLGPMHRQAFNEYLQDFNQGHIPDHLDLFDIGYPKSDVLIDGYLPGDKKIIEILSLDPVKKTILYAPAFNEGASLREYGLQVIELLALLSEYNVIVKLPIDCYQPVTNIYATGGIDWNMEIRVLEKKYSNLKLYMDYYIDPLLACADILITCISTVGFEFMALNKPVIFIDTPKYYSGYLKRRFPDKDTIAWSRRTTANGGKEFGLVVKDIHELPDAITYILKHPGEYPKQQEKLKTYLLYNKGNAAQVAVDKINALLRLHVKSQRPSTTLSFLRYCVLEAMNKLCN